MVRVRWKEGSKYQTKSETQAEAMKVLREALACGRNGIVILPCGTGKSALIVELAIEAGTMCLILCYEKQGVVQIANLLREHTSLQHHQVCMLTGESKDTPNALVCFVVMTYNLYASSVGGTRRGRTSELGAFLKACKWNFVACDEAHHVCAPTYRPFLENINTEHVFGFTGTLFRGDSVANETREEHEKRVFGWFGEVLFRRTCQELEAKGLIAKVRRRTVMTPFTKEFQFAHQEASGQMRVNVHSVHPTKLNCLKHLCAMHKAAGHMGMVFATHLYVAKILKIVLGDRWEILAGSSSHGDETTHTTLQNARIVARFNAGELDGLISTSVGESSLDVYHPAFCFLVVLDAHGGEASAAQRAGRLFRTPRIDRKPDQSDEALLSERLAGQKQAYYYDLVTPGTEEESAANAREAKFVAEGYEPSQPIELGRIMGMAATAQTPLDFRDLRDCLRLLKETLSYQELGRNAALGKSAAAAVRAPHAQKIAKIRSLAKDASAIFKTRYEKQAQRLVQHRPTVKARARAANRNCLLATSLPRESREIFRKLRLSPQLLRDLDIDLSEDAADEAERDESESDD